MEKLFEQITKPENIRAAFHQIKEKWFDPTQERYSTQAPGLDGLTLPEFEKDLENQIEACRDFFLNPGREFYPQILTRVPKEDPGKFRDIYLLTLRDKIIHKAMTTPMENALDRYFYPNLYAFRRGKYYGSIAAARKVRKLLKENKGACWVFKADISHYFDSIVPRIMLEKFVRQRRLVKGILHSPILGVPTGSSLSPLCANLYLIEMDRAMFRGGFHYLRYCDDLLLVSPDLKEIEKGRKIIQDFLERHSLEISPDKTFVYKPHQPFVYLGYEYSNCEVHVGPKAIENFQEWIYGLFPRGLYRDFPNETPEQRKELLRKILADVNTGKLTSEEKTAVNTQQLPWIRAFPIVDNDKIFRDMDRFIKNRIRMLITRRASAKNYKIVPEDWFRELGYKSLVGVYYRVTQRRSLAPYYGWRRYFGSNFSDLEGPKKRTPLGKKIRRIKEQIQFLRKAIKGEI